MLIPAAAGNIQVNKMCPQILQYAATSAGTNYYNLAKDISILTAKNEEITDRKGNLYGYWCKIQQSSIATEIDAGVLGLIPNTWKVRNAVKKFHFAREAMFRESGVTKKEMGKYGRTIRPYFDVAHVTATDRTPRLLVGSTVGNATGGEWTYTSLASSPTYLESETFDDLHETEGVLADSWKLNILGTHIKDDETPSGTKMWTSVGMVQAYNEDRMEQRADAGASTKIVSPNNPLAALISQTMVSGEVTEIAADQEMEAPPYDLADNGDSTEAQYMVNTMPSTNVGSKSFGLVFVPAGLISFSNGVADSNGLQIEVVGKELCKDVY